MSETATPPAATSDAPSSGGPAEALARELYWAPPPVPDLPPGVQASSAAGLAQRWIELEERMRFDYTQVFPPGEDVVEIGSGAKLRLKRAIFRAIRPAIKRYDRIGADTARLGYDTAQAVEATNRELTAVLGELERLSAQVGELQARLGIEPSEATKDAETDGA